jgi:hypothetical protein
MNAQLQTIDERAEILRLIGKWVAQRPGLEWCNYSTGNWRESATAYRAESRAITRDLHDARALMSAIGWRDIDANMLREGFRAYSGRLSLEDREGRLSLSYCAGQYWPTEYRKAACAVLAAVLWSYWSQSMPAANGWRVRCLDDEGQFVDATSKVFGKLEHAQAYCEGVAKSRRAYLVDCFDGLSAGDWLRKMARRELGAHIQRRWFS